MIGDGNRLAHAAALAVGGGALGGLQPALPPRPARARQDPPAGRDRQLPARQRARPERPLHDRRVASPTSSSPPCAERGARRSSAATATSTSSSSTTSSSSRASTHTEEEFFHTFNALYEGGSQLVLSADRIPSELSTLADAAARPLRVGPDGRGRAAEPRHPAHRPAAPGPRGRRRDRRRRRPPELAGGIDANVRQLHGALTRVIAHASLMARPLNSELIAELIPQRRPSAGRRPSRRSSSASPMPFGISRAELIGSSRAATPAARAPGRDPPDPRADRPLAAPDRPPLRRSRSLDGPQRAAPGRGRRRRGPRRWPNGSTELRAAIHSSAGHGALTADRRCKNQCFPTADSTGSNPHPSADPPRSRPLPQALTQLKKALYQLKLNDQTRRTRLQAVDRLPRRLDPRRDPGALGSPDRRRRGRRDASPPPTWRWGLQTTSTPRSRARGSVLAARPPARRARPLAR